MSRRVLRLRSAALMRFLAILICFSRRRFWRRGDLEGYGSAVICISFDIRIYRGPDACFPLL